MTGTDKGSGDSRSDDYVPGYLSTNRDFDPQTASFFYESGDSVPVTASTASSQHAIAKTEDPQQQTTKLAAIKEENEQTLSSAQRVLSGEYLAAQRQYQQNLIQRQQNLLRSARLQQIVELDGTTRQYSSRFVQSATSASSNCFPHADIYQQQNVAASNMQCSAGVPPETVDGRVQPSSQKTPPQVIMSSRCMPGVQSAGSYMVQQIPGGTGVQYATVPVRYMSHEGELQTPMYVSPQGQVTPVPTGAIIYMQDGRQVSIQSGQFAYTSVPLEYVQGTSITCDGSIDLGTAVTKAEPVHAVDEQNTVKDGRKRRRLKKEKTVKGEVAAISVVTKKKRGRKRKKVENEAGAEGKHRTQAANRHSHQLTHGELLRQKKRNMAFPKGTFLVRYADLDNEDYAGHIWLVDNHQLLQKYTYDGLDAYNVKVFSRTERYSGWLCTCPWLYHPLSDVKGVFGNMEKIAITNYPTREELLARREEELLKAPPPPTEQELKKEPQATEEAVHSEADHTEEEHEPEMHENTE